MDIDFAARSLRLPWFYYRSKYVSPTEQYILKFRLSICLFEWRESLCRLSFLPFLCLVL